MSVRVSLRHLTTYDYGRPIDVSTQTVRLRPTSSLRSPVHSYHLRVSPEAHILSWQKDSFGNSVAQVTLLEKTQRLGLSVHLDMDLQAHNPFEFALHAGAQEWPFEYDRHEVHNVLRYLSPTTEAKALAKFLPLVDRTPRPTFDFLARLNQLIYGTLRYETRLEPGVQSPEETLALGCGSCRDSAWLLVQVCRHLGLAARFVSGYLVELAPLQGVSASASDQIKDSLALHAWTDVYLPGAGWVGLDATSGLFAAEGHIPLAVAADPEGASPVEGLVERSEGSFSYEMSVQRVSIAAAPQG